MAWRIVQMVALLALANAAQAQWQLGSRQGWGNGQWAWDGSLQARSEVHARRDWSDLGLRLELQGVRKQLPGRPLGLLPGQTRQPVAQQGRWALSGEHDLPLRGGAWWGWRLAEQFNSRPLEPSTQLSMERAGYLSVGQLLPLGELTLEVGRARDGQWSARGWRMPADAEQRRSLEVAWRMDLPGQLGSMELSQFDERSQSPQTWRLRATRLLLQHRDGWRALLERDSDLDMGRDAVALKAVQWRWGLLWTRPL